MDSYILDTNSLLRFLLNDIPSQAEQTAKLLHQASRHEVQANLTSLVITEIVFTLTKSYKWTRPEVVQNLLTLVASPALVVEHQNLQISALNLFQNTSLSFVDCLLISQAKHSGKKLFTFDKQLLSHL